MTTRSKSASALFLASLLLALVAVPNIARATNSAPFLEIQAYRIEGSTWRLVIQTKEPELEMTCVVHQATGSGQFPCANGYPDSSFSTFNVDPDQAWRVVVTATRPNHLEGVDGDVATAYIEQPADPRPPVDPEPPVLPPVPEPRSAPPIPDARFAITPRGTGSGIRRFYLPIVCPLMWQNADVTGCTFDFTVRIWRGPGSNLGRLITSGQGMYLNPGQKGVRRTMEADQVYKLRKRFGRTLPVLLCTQSPEGNMCGQGTITLPKGKPHVTREARKMPISSK